MIELRPYQHEAVDSILSSIEASENALCVMPCGTGKTEVMIESVLRLYKTHRTLVILNRVELYDQTLRRFSKALTPKNIRISSVCGSRNKFNSDGDVVIGTIQTLSRHNFREPPELVICDEVHNAFSFQYLELFEKFKPKIIGFTATPFRTTGKIYGEGNLFKKITFRKEIPFFIDQKFLVPPKLKGSKNEFNLSGVGVRNGEWDFKDLSRLTNNDKLVLAQVTDALDRVKDRKKIVWFCCTIEHAKKVHEYICQTGEITSLLHSKQSRFERDRNKNIFEKTECRHLVFVTIVSEGYDYPPVDTVVMMRPTRSPVLYCQVVGRSMRPYGDKTDCLILDYGQVIKHLGPIDDPVLLSMKKKEADQQVEENENKGKFCKNCYCYIRFPYPEECPDCGVPLIEKREVKGTDKPEEHLNILASLNVSPLGVLKSVAKVEINPNYVSKKGNHCWTVGYYSNLFARYPMVTEYFVKSRYQDNPQNCRRLRELHCTEFEDDQILIKSGIVSGVWIKKNSSGYDEVVRVEFFNEREDHRDENSIVA